MPWLPGGDAEVRQQQRHEKSGLEARFPVIDRLDRLLTLLGSVFELVAALLDVLTGTLDGIAAGQRHAKGENDSDHCGKFFHDRTPSSSLLTLMSVESPSASEVIEANNASL
jgi:hypothetical protein